VCLPRCLMTHIDLLLASSSCCCSFCSLWKGRIRSPRFGYWNPGDNMCVACMPDPWCQDNRSCCLKLVPGCSCCLHADLQGKRNHGSDRDRRPPYCVTLMHRPDMVSLSFRPDMKMCLPCLFTDRAAHEHEYMRYPWQ
jgi:hypothetical protein